jgi:GNAT superfamily N-acetyltransferase
MGLELRAFEDGDVEAAATLLAERHRRHRSFEPTLPDVADMAAQVERAWGVEGASGSLALESGEVVGYLIGAPKPDPGGAFAWVEVAGHASRNPEVIRDLYGSAAGPWVEAGLSRHMAFVPLLTDLIDPWFRLSFGASAALAVQETSPQPVIEAGVDIRPSTPEDLEPSAAFERLLWQHNARPPSFSGIATPDLQTYLDDWRTTWDEPQYTHFVAERDGRIVGHLLLYRRPEGDLRVPPNSIDLANAATDPQVRGDGVGLALFAHAMTWAHEHGFTSMITDWRMTNLLASRFWPARGFRATFLRLYRSIP